MSINVYLWSSLFIFDENKITLTMIRFACMLVLSATLLVGCGNNKTSSKDLEVIAKAEGPFFAGSNSLIAEVQLNMVDLLGDAEFKEVANVKINGITIEMEDGQELSLDQFTSAVIQVVSDNSPMTSIAIMNPIKVVDNELKMTTSEEAEVTSFFQEGKFSLLLDLDFIEDSYAEELKAEVKINLTIEYK